MDDQTNLSVSTTTSTPLASANVDSDPANICTICLQPYNTPNGDGSIEVPALTACGHTFGHTCIERWLARPMTHDGPSCPVCRFTLKFKACKHAIAAVNSRDEKFPLPEILKSDGSNTPPWCFTCGVQRLKWHTKFDSLADEKKWYVDILLTWANTKIQSERKGEDEAFEKQKSAYEAEINDIDGEITDVKKRLAREEVMYLRKIEVGKKWHLKVDTSKWRLPGERYEDDDVTGLEAFNAEYDAEDDNGDDDDEDEDLSDFDAEGSSGGEIIQGLNHLAEEIQEECDTGDVDANN